MAALPETRNLRNNVMDKTLRRGKNGHAPQIKN
jgi:hypothetical protein